VDIGQFDIPHQILLSSAEHHKVINKLSFSISAKNRKLDYLIVPISGKDLREDQSFRRKVHEGLEWFDEGVRSQLIDSIPAVQRRVEGALHSHGQGLEMIFMIYCLLGVWIDNDIIYASMKAR